MIKSKSRSENMFLSHERRSQTRKKSPPLRNKHLEVHYLIIFVAHPLHFFSFSPTHVSTAFIFWEEVFSPQKNKISNETTVFTQKLFVLSCTIDRKPGHAFINFCISQRPQKAKGNLGNDVLLFKSHKSGWI